MEPENIPFISNCPRHYSLMVIMRMHFIGGVFNATFNNISVISWQSQAFKWFLVQKYGF